MRRGKGWQGEEGGLARREGEGVRGWNVKGKSKGWDDCLRVQTDN